MRYKPSTVNCQWQTGEQLRPVCLAPRPRCAFSLVEILVVMTLLSVIVLALMAVFSSTQRAFRASVNQADVLAGGRAAMDMIATDLRGITPSDGASNAILSFVSSNSPVNLCVAPNAIYYTAQTPLVQSLPGATAGVQRTNVLQYFFFLGRENTKWTGTGYVVNNTTNALSLYPLYRFYEETNVQNNPFYLFNDFNNDIQFGQWTNMSHVLDGVVHMTLRAYDTNGVWISNLGQPYIYTNALNTLIASSSYYGEQQLFMFSNTVPASVQIDLGVLENRELTHAESIQNDMARSNYLAQQVGAVHLFRQRVPIPNVDPAAYQ